MFKTKMMKTLIQIVYGVRTTLHLKNYTMLKMSDRTLHTPEQGERFKDCVHNRK